MKGEVFILAKPLNHEVVVFMLLAALPFGVMLPTEGNAVLRVISGARVMAFKEVGTVRLLHLAIRVSTMLVPGSNVETERGVGGFALDVAHLLEPLGALL